MSFYLTTIISHATRWFPAFWVATLPSHSRPVAGIDHSRVWNKSAWPVNIQLTTTGRKNMISDWVEVSINLSILQQFKMINISPQHSGGWTPAPLKAIFEMILGWSGIPTPWNHFSNIYFPYQYPGIISAITDPHPEIISAGVLGPENHFKKMTLYVMNYFPKNSARTLKSFQKHEMISGGWYS